MRKETKRLIAVLLTVLMILSAVPSAAFASLTDNDPEENSEIVEALAGIVGSEDEAKLYYDILRNYGLLDEDGETVRKVETVIDGDPYTFEELCELLSGDYDGNRLAYVDGAPITLENLRNIIVIEDYISYLRDTYFYDGEWTAEHEEYYADLLGHLESGNVRLVTSVDPLLTGDYSGINHGAMVSFTDVLNEDTFTVTAVLSGAAPGQKVSFSYETLSGSAKVEHLSGTVSMTADAEGNAEYSFDVGFIPETSETLLSDVASYWYLSVKDLVNASFRKSGKSSATVPMSVSASASATVGEGKDLGYIPESFSKLTNGSLTIELDAEELYFVNSGTASCVTEILLSGDSFLYIDTALDSGFPGYNNLIFSYELSDVSGRIFFENTLNIDVESSEVTEEGIRYTFVRGESTEKYNEVGLLNGTDEYGRTVAPVILDRQFGFTFSVVGYNSRPDLKEIDYVDITDVTKLYPAFSFEDRRSPEVKAIYAPEGEYFYGQHVPVIVEFSEPVSAQSAYITVNGTRVYAKENGSGFSSRLSFPYDVKENDSAQVHVTSVYAEDKSGNGISPDYEPVSGSSAGLKLKDVVLTSCLPMSAVTDMSLKIDMSDVSKPLLTVTLKLSEDSELTAWLADDIASDGTSASLAAAVKGYDLTPFVLQGDTFAGGTMTASFVLQPAGEDSSFTVELYHDAFPVIGRILRADQSATAFLTEDDMSVSLVVRSSDGGFYEYENSNEPVIYVQDSPMIRACFDIAEIEFPFLNKDLTTVLDETGEPLDGSAHFAWSTSDGTVANIDANGTVTPTGKAGSVSIAVTALTGGEGGRRITVWSEPVTFGTGSSPYLIIPNKNIDASSGTDVTVYWSSNLRSLDPNAVFDLTVTDSEGRNVFMLGGIAECGAAVPGELLLYSYEEGSGNTFTVKVSSSYGGEVFSAEAVITISSDPARVFLTPLSNYYLTDTEDSVGVSWRITSFDRYSSEGPALFRLYVTRNDEPLIDTDVPGTGTDGIFSGYASVPVRDIVSDPGDPTGYRDVYTVTVQAKNGADSTWSYDSYVFYVYDEDALRIWVNGEYAGNSLTLSNIPQISQMSQEEILALRRDISLQAVVSANYGDYAWNDLSDRLSWSVSDRETADLKYRQGSYFSSTANYTYTDYRPTAEFLLAGLKDGDAVITETHTLTGICEALNVKVETLKDRLYLISVAPAARATAVYTNGNGEEKTVTGTADGEFAIYEESGIASDVYITAVIDGCEYCGTCYGNDLISGEKDPADVTFYPCNNLILRRAAYAYVYVKNPDGTPYQGDVIFRGGVYVNGEYMENGRFAFGEEEGKRTFVSGDEDRTVTLGSDGKLTVVMDSSSWETSRGPVGDGDEISYVFLIERPEDTGYYPLFVKIDAGRNEDDYVRSGDASVTFRKNEESGENTFILDERYVMYSRDQDYSSETDLMGCTNCIGISPIVEEADLVISVMWWGQHGEDDRSIVLVSDSGSLYGQSCETAYYPFIDQAVSTVTVHLDHYNASRSGIGASPGPLYLRMYSGSSLTMKTLPFRIADTSASPMTVNDFAKMAGDVDDVAAGARTGGVNQYGQYDDYVDVILDWLADEDYSPDKEHAGGFSVQIMATVDPTVYIIYMTMGISSMTNRKVTGAYADETSKGMATYLPGIREMGLLFGGTKADYVEKYMKDICNADEKKTVKNFEYILTGYVEYRRMADGEGNWSTRLMSGGFDAGGGMTAVKRGNDMIGPVPFTWEVRVGGTAAVALDMLLMEYVNSLNQVTDATEFLTNFRIYLYLKLFGGVGIDYSFVAAKIGAFGQIALDINLWWLNRPDLDEIYGEVRYPDLAVMDNTDPTLDGQSVQIHGQIGFEYFFKLWLFSYEGVIASWPFKSDLWEYNDNSAIAELWAKSQDYYNTYLHDIAKTKSLSLSNGGEGDTVSIDLMPTVQSADYLVLAESVWNDGTLKQPLFGAVLGTEVKELLTNADPFASPVLSDDGNILVFLDSDGQYERVRYAVMNGSGYERGEFLSTEGGGDSQHTAAGTKDFAVAAWSTLGENQTKEAGSVLTPEDQLIMLQGSEIYVSVYDGTGWNTVRFTDNDVADAAPVAAVSGEHALVAWRSVASSNFEGNIFDFNQKDVILYSIWDPASGTWSGPDTLYNGTGGNVTGINAAMLPDGTAAVICTLDTDSFDSTSDDREIVWSVISPDGEVTRNVRATSDDAPDENPQIASTRINGEDVFVAAWYTADDILGSDIRMVDFGPDGIIRGDLPQSLEKAVIGDDLLITSDFRFTKNSSSIEDLALVWVDRNMSDEAGTSVKYDTLNSVKFYTYGDGDRQIGLTSAQPVCDAPDSTLIDSFDVIVERGNIRGVFAGTFYDSERTVEKRGITKDGAIVTYEAMYSVTGLYTVKGYYADSIEVTNINVDFMGVIPGAKIPVAFSVRNTGIDPVTDLSIDLGGSKAAIMDLALLPGDSVTVFVDYRVPSDTVSDVDYTVTAGTRAGSCSDSGTAGLGKRDIEMTSAVIIEEYEGLRTIEMKVFNHSYALLKGSGDTVVISFYSDTTCENPIEGLEPVVISDDVSLGTIDEGGFTKQVTFDANRYLASMEDSPSEIPEGGINIYIKASVLRNGEEMTDINSENDTALVTCENLEVRKGRHVSVDAQLTVNEDSADLTVTLMNNRLSETTTGNVIATLFGEDGEILEQLQSYDPEKPESGLITLGGEEREKVYFTFTKPGSYADVQFTDLILDDPSDASLAVFSSLNVPEAELSVFEETGDGSFRGTVEKTGEDVLKAVISPSDPEAVVTLDGEVIGGYTELPLETGENVFDFTVTARDGVTRRHYVLTVIKPVTYDVTVTGGSSYPEKAAEGDTVLIKADEVPEGMKFDHWVADSEDVVFDDPASLVTSFTMPDHETKLTAVYSYVPVEYSITGDGQIYVLRSGKTLSFGCDGDPAMLKGIMVDGKPADEEDYVISEDPLTAELTSAYLDTLSKGEHTVRFIFENGESGEAAFTVTEVPPTTGTGRRLGLLISMMWLALVMIAYSTVTYTKKRNAR